MATGHLGTRTCRRNRRRTSPDHMARPGPLQRQALIGEPCGSFLKTVPSPQWRSLQQLPPLEAR
eukprot:8685684-Pyramimonas_sp.AAC.1